MKFRKRISLGKGVKLNVSKSGLSTTIGVKGLSANIGKKGAYLNTGIPGTGIYDRNKIEINGKNYKIPNNVDIGNYNPYSTLTKVFMVFFGVLFIMLGIIFLLLGIFANELRIFAFFGALLLLSGIWIFSLIRRNKNLIKIVHELEMNSSNKNETVDNSQEEEEERKKYILEAEKIVRNMESFNDAIIVHGVINNTVAFNKIGHIALFTYGNGKLIKIENLKNIELLIPKENDFPKLFYCVFQINDMETPECKMLLTVNEPDEANKIFQIIKDNIIHLRKSK